MFCYDDHLKRQMSDLPLEILLSITSQISKLRSVKMFVCAFRMCDDLKSNLEMKIKRKAVEMIARNVKKCKIYHDLNVWNSKNSNIYYFWTKYKYNAQPLKRKMLLIYPEYLINSIPEFLEVYPNWVHSYKSMCRLLDSLPELYRRKRSDVVRFIQSPLITMKMIQTVGL